MRRALTLISTPYKHTSFVLALCLASGFLLLMYRFQFDIASFNARPTENKSFGKPRHQIPKIDDFRKDNGRNARDPLVNGTVATSVRPTKFEKFILKSPIALHPHKILSDSSSSSSSTCSFPRLDPFDRELTDLIHTFPKLDCSSGIPSVVKVRSDELLIDLDGHHSSHGLSNVSFTCRYRSHAMAPGQDFETAMSPWSQPFTVRIKLRPYEEHLIVECRTTDKTDSLVAKSYLSIVRDPAPYVDQELERRHREHVSRTDTREALSVLIVGIDGLSRSQMIRSMPKTGQLMADTPGAFELTQHNKVGMNTFPNVIPLLTGKKVKELTDWDATEPMDLIPFIWEDFERSGYTTQLVLDKKTVTAFHNSKLGWSKPPVMYSNRPTVVVSETDEIIRAVDENCIGDTPEVSHFTDYQMQLITREKRKSYYNYSSSSGGNRSSWDSPFFSYSFFVRLTHDDNNRASAGDEIYHQFFHKLIQQRLLKNTIVIFFSDHGPRFGPIRRTVPGMMEGSNPFCFILVPVWLLDKYPHIHSALSANRHRLTTNFDLYETLKDVLHFQGRQQKDQKGHTMAASRGVSLFREIPRNRSCLDAGVDTVWCSCNRMVRLDSRLPVVEIVAQRFVSIINNFTTASRALCLPLKVKTIRYAFRVEADDQYKPEDRGSFTLYKVAMETTPGDAVYEGLVRHPSVETGLSSTVGPVDRLNMFQNQAKCMKQADLKPFCFCRGNAVLSRQRNGEVRG